MTVTQRGMLLVLSGPSGAGKGTLGMRLLETDPTFRFSVSATTRKAREGEVDGVHYHFWTVEEFERQVQADAFIEHFVVHGNHYGTLKKSVADCLDRCENVLLDIDPQGARAVAAAMPDCVSVFILPPSYDELAIRLKTRNTDDPVEIARRLKNAHGEIAQLTHYQYAIINDTVDHAFQTLQTIIAAERFRTNRFLPHIE